MKIVHSANVVLSLFDTSLPFLRLSILAQKVPKRKIPISTKKEKKVREMKDFLLLKALFLCLVEAKNG